MTAPDGADPSRTAGSGPGTATTGRATTGTATTGITTTGTGAAAHPGRADRRAVDARFFGLVDTGEPGRSRFVVDPHLCRHDRRLYGGTAVAVALAAAERLTGREAIWATAQLVSTAPLGARVDVHAEELAPGHRTSQVRVTATCGGEVVFVALGATAEPKVDGIAGALEPWFDVPGPEESKPAFWSESAVGWHLAVEMRSPPLADDDRRICLWSRYRDGQPFTAARLAFVADLVPLGVMRACGINGAGTSLDNTLRVGSPAGTGWVLVDVRPHLAAGGYGHGSVHLWAEDGTLLATGSQTARLVVLEHDPFDGVPPG